MGLELVHQHRDLPAIPEPADTPLPALLDACEAVTAWADQCDDRAAVEDAYDRMAAIAEYLARQDHALAAQAALRRLEVRIGELTPEQRPGPVPVGTVRSHASELNRGRLSEFRRMAEHAPKVEEVIARSTDAEPPSRRKVLDAIREVERVARAEAEQLAAQRQQDRQEVAALNAEFQPPDFDPVENQRLVERRGRFSRLCEDITAFGDHEDLLEDLLSAQRPERFYQRAQGAHGWLSDLLEAWEIR